MIGDSVPWRDELLESAVRLPARARMGIRRDPASGEASEELPR